MPFIIDAWLNQGKPNLRLCDPESGEVCFTWQSDHFGALEDPQLRLEFQQLFKQLILMSVAHNQDFKGTPALSSTRHLFSSFNHKYLQSNHE